MDTVSKKERSRIMSQVKGRGNQSTELRLIALFKEHHVTGWRRGYPLLGKPDFVFPKPRLAIFVDGCFWHGCNRHGRIPDTNRGYWSAKIERNIQRDKEVTKQLRGKQWTVIRIWEHELRKTEYKRKMKRIVDIVQP